MRSSWFLTAAFIGTNTALVQPLVSAKSAVEVGRIAKAITVEIKETGSSRVGSGILLQQQGNVYTVLTAGHVVENGRAFTIKTADGQIHRSIEKSIRSTGNKIDLGTVRFQSSKNYTLAKIGTSNSLEVLSPIYVAGFPESTYVLESGTLNVTRGEVIGNATNGNAQGYSLIYSNITRPGMSGGPVLNEAGELVAIHGQGDREGKEGEGAKTGRNIGIVVERFGTVSLALGVQLNQDVVALAPSKTLNASDYFLRGNDKLKIGDYRGSLADYDQAIALNPKFDNAYVNRADVKKNHLNDFPGAMADYSQAIAINTKNCCAYDGRASLKVKLNDLKGALNDYTQAIAADPKNYVPYLNRGVLKSQKLNDVPGALSDYNRAIAISPNEPVSYYNRGALKYSNLKDLNGALTDFNQAIILNPKYAEAYHARGVVKGDGLNDLSGALNDYNRAITLKPKYAEWYSDRGVLKDKLNDVPGALADFKQSLTINSKYYLAYANRAKLKLRLNDLGGALADYNQVIISDPKNHVAYLGRGSIKSQLNDLAGSLADYNQSIALNPKFAEGYNDRGFLKQSKLNDVQGALADYNQAIALDPKFALAYGNRALLKKNKLNDRAGAIQDLRQAAKIYRAAGKMPYVQATIELLQELGVQE
jgi:tetratricopeptide (TPR) repeat protein